MRQAREVAHVSAIGVSRVFLPRSRANGISNGDIAEYFVPERVKKT
jgi:hypothetical protein